MRRLCSMTLLIGLLLLVSAAERGRRPVAKPGVDRAELQGTNPTPTFEVLSTDHRDGVMNFRANLDGDQEVPPVETDTSGMLRVKFNHDLTEADFDLKAFDGMAITQAHLHCAPEGANGPVVVFLFGFVPGGFDVHGRLAKFTLTDTNIAAVGADCTPAIATITDLADAMLDGNIYVNVHSVANPPGEIRGQLALRGHGHGHDDDDDDGDDDDDEDDEDDEDDDDDDDDDEDDDDDDD